MISRQRMVIKQNKKEDNVVSQLTFKAGEDLPMDSFSSEVSLIGVDTPEPMPGL